MSKFLCSTPPNALSPKKGSIKGSENNDGLHAYSKECTAKKKIIKLLI